MTRLRRGGVALTVSWGLLSCGGGAAGPVAVAPGGSRNQAHWPADDRSMCERIVHFRGNASLDATDSVGPGAMRPNIRRVYKVAGPREDRHTILVCREVDTNLDGIKDVVRTFNDKGEPLHEESDTNYDGLVDHWLNFVDGRIAEEDVDATLASGQPNVWKFYNGGALTRIRRNTHCPGGKPDTWEIYVNDRLERVGSDLSCDGHVDRWDRDAQLQAKEESAAAEASDAGSDAESSTAPSSTALPDDAGSAARDAGSHLGDGGQAKGPRVSPRRAKAKP
jgi:DNA-binding transcriptional MerR regulator